MYEVKDEMVVLYDKPECSHFLYYLFCLLSFRCEHLCHSRVNPLDKFTSTSLSSTCMPRVFIKSIFFLSRPLNELICSSRCSSNLREYFLLRIIKLIIRVVDFAFSSIKMTLVQKSTWLQLGCRKCCSSF